MMGVGVTGVALLLLLGFNLDRPPVSLSSNSTASHTPSPPAAMTKPVGPDLMLVAKRNKRLAALKPHFVITTDEFDKKITIRHRAFSKYMNGNGTSIEAEIYDNSLVLASEYVAEEWIFHDSFTVKVGEDQLSATGPRKEEVINGGVVEMVALGPLRSGPIAELIASAGSSPVRVRLDGKYYKDYTLRPAHQKAIAETVEYYHLLTDRQ